MFVVQKTEMSTWTRIQNVLSSGNNLNSAKAPPTGKVSVIFHGNKLIIEEAPEPGDIIWENITKSTKTKILWRFISFLIFISISMIALLMFGLIYFFQRSYLERVKELVLEKKSISNEVYMIDLFSVILAVIFIIWNEFFLPFLFKLTTK